MSMLDQWLSDVLAASGNDGLIADIRDVGVQVPLAEDLDIVITAVGPFLVAEPTTISRPIGTRLNDADPADSVRAVVDQMPDQMARRLIDMIDAYEAIASAVGNRGEIGTVGALVTSMRRVLDQPYREPSFIDDTIKS